jgi:hypothetical protein
VKKHKVLIVTCSLVIVLLGFLSFWILLSEHHENVSKQALLTEEQKLPLPGSCTEQYRAYQMGGVDTNSAWHVVYKCAVTAETAKGVIAKRLAGQGFTASDDNDLGLSHFKNSEFQVDYDFIADSDSQATVSITVYRLHRSY